MSTAARPTPAPPSVPLHIEIEQLRRDLTSAHARNRTLIRELTRAASAPTVVAVLPGPNRELDHYVFLSNGIRLEHRWQEEGGWRYVQAATVPGTLAAIVDGVFSSERTEPVYDGMAVVG